jgi:hypothetical protein
MPEPEQHAVAAPGDSPVAVGDLPELVRVTTMLATLQEEARRIELDDAAREALAGIYQRAVDTICEVLSPALRDELGGFTIDLADPPGEAELRVAQAALTGWLSGLFQGMQAAFAGHMATQQLQQLQAGAQQSAPTKGGGYI